MTALSRHVVFVAPRRPFDTFLVLLLLVFGCQHAANAAAASSYMERLQTASRLTSSATADPASLVSRQEAAIVQELLALSSADVQQAVLASAAALSPGGASSVVRNTMSAGAVAASPVMSEACSNDIAATIIGLGQRQMWALQMADAAGKPRPDILGGNFVWPGAYDVCFTIRSNVSKPSGDQFSGRYCTATVQLPVQSAFGSAAVSWGLCAPSTCSGVDMTVLLTDVLARLNRSMSIQVTCLEKDKPLDAKAKVAITICSVLLALLVAGTVLDVLLIQMPKWRSDDVLAFTTNGPVTLDERQPLLQPTKPSGPKAGLAVQILVAFSVYTNGSKLLSTRQPPGSLTCIHGIRFLSMTWVVLGHSFLFPLTSAENLGRYLPNVLQRWSFQTVASATASVDSFFAISGLLVTLLTLNEMKKNEGKLNWFMFYFHRFWRLTPAYMLVIMVYTCLSPYWGDGPLLQQALPDRDICNKNWWTNLLYINNFYGLNETCLAQSWYLANDMQFYILSPLIFLPMFYYPLLGLGSAAVFLLVSAITPAVLTLKDGLPPGIIAKAENSNTTIWDYMDFYNKPYNRMGPYAVGMIAGYFLYRVNCKLQLNKVVNLCAWAVATCCALAVLYGLHDASSGSPMPLSTSAFYNAVNRHVWGACVCWVVVACVTGNGGFVNTLLSWPALVPLSRLTYCIYLLHIMIMELYLQDSNTTFYMNDVNVVMFFLSVLVVSYMAAAVASLAFEAPMMGLEKVLLHRKPPGEDSKGDASRI